MVCYPNHNWKSKEQFKEELHKQFIQRLGNQLGIKSSTHTFTQTRLADAVVGMEEWYNVTVKEVDELGGQSVLKKHNGSLLRALHLVYHTRHNT